MNQSSFSDLQEEENKYNQRNRNTSSQKYDKQPQRQKQRPGGFRNQQRRQSQSSSQQADGLKSRLKIEKSNPSKKINKSKRQRTQFDKHEGLDQNAQTGLDKIQENYRLVKKNLLRI
ncbi:hypothetical protein OXYTRIMIC_644 [Oxytricha trifallax]|uniref:Uncharacterized protein n=1 Tax=Oxytricha trifallax TaxID=1172189 RepID=A0A073I0X5_9SPIT|nr:hypothetical protein OXYTRIMIC_644 [Oxytricha trifallax]